MTRRPTVRLMVGLPCAALLAGCVLGISHTLHSVDVVNASDAAIVVREGRTKWTVPAKGSGQLFLDIADAKPAETHDYEILDADSCELLGSQQVVLDGPGLHVLAVQADNSIGLATFDPSRQSVTLESSDDVCPGKADGWGLWIENATDALYYVRDGAEVARVSPNSTRSALGGYSETSLIELFDAECRLLEVVARSGWGPVKGTILDDQLTLDTEATPPAQLLSFGLVAKCKFAAGPTASP